MQSLYRGLAFQPRAQDLWALELSGLSLIFSGLCATSVKATSMMSGSYQNYKRICKMRTVGALACAVWCCVTCLSIG